MMNDGWTTQDERYMARALALAEKAYGRVSPNPYVGAVIVKDGHIIGEDYHQKVGEAHAEVNAINDVKTRFSTDALKGATIYVTLEPCCHVGRTGACTKAIIDAGIGRVISAMQDPNPKVQGKGHALLTSHGIDVATGLLEDKARYINRHFIHNQIHQRPFVTLKAALSLDGKLATKTGESQWITCADAREKTHYIRGLHNAILIGKGTLLSDNPSLTVRYGFGDDIASPLRVVLITDFRYVQADLTLFDTSYVPTLVMTSDEAINNPTWQPLFTKLAAQNVQLQSLPQLTSTAVMQFLKSLHIQSVMLEGGAKIYQSFLQAACVDELALFYGPRLIGDKDAYELWQGSNVSQLDLAPVLSIYQTEKIGKSVYVNAFFTGEE